jgi:glycyl-tRNA synthetase
MGSPRLTVDDPADYLRQMRANGIILSRGERKQVIWAEAQRLAATVGGVVAPDESLLDEVANLVEQPTPLIGTFEKRFLNLPRDVLITVMRSKQRYFPVQDAAGNLLPHFIAVRNGDSQHVEEVVLGNENVLTARFADADFFFREDLKKKLAERGDRLKTMTFQEKLGSVYDKNQRLVKAAPALGALLGLSAEALQVAAAAAPLAKADQGTQMVVEMTSLEGIMGREYALREGLPPAVANAIFEHYLPRGAGDLLPESEAGALLALTDRLDSLVGLFAVGLAPTGGADPFALRRAAGGVVQILLRHGWAISLRAALPLIAAQQPVPVSPAVLEEVAAFIAVRLEVILREEQGIPYDVAAAVLREQSDNPVRALAGAKELSAWTARPNWNTVLDSFARCVRITRDKPAYTLNPDALTPAESEALYAAAKGIHDQLKASDNVGAFLTAFERIVPTVTAFFDKVLVMDEDATKRENRLALLQYVAALAKGRADLSQLSGF